MNTDTNISASPLRGILIGLCLATIGFAVATWLGVPNLVAAHGRFFLYSALGAAVVAVSLAIAVALNPSENLARRVTFTSMFFVATFFVLGIVSLNMQSGRAITLDVLVPGAQQIYAIAAIGTALLASGCAAAYFRNSSRAAGRNATTIGCVVVLAVATLGGVLVGDSYRSGMPERTTAPPIETPEDPVSANEVAYQLDLEEPRILSGAAVFVILEGVRMTAYERATGDKRWVFDMGSNDDMGNDGVLADEPNLRVSMPTVDDTEIVVARRDDATVILDAITGEVMWRIGPDRPPVRGESETFKDILTLLPGASAVGQPPDTVGDDFVLTALDGDTGDTDWKIDLDCDTDYSTARDSVVAYLDCDQAEPAVHLVDRTTGDFIATVEPEAYPDMLSAYGRYFVLAWDIGERRTFQFIDRQGRLIDKIDDAVKNSRMVSPLSETFFYIQATPDSDLGELVMRDVELFTTTTTGHANITSPSTLSSSGGQVYFMGDEQLQSIPARNPEEVTTHTTACSRPFITAAPGAVIQLCADGLIALS